MNRRDLFKRVAAILPAASACPTLALEPDVCPQDFLIVEVADVLDDAERQAIAIKIASVLPEGARPTVLIADRLVSIRVERGIARVERLDR